MKSISSIRMAGGLLILGVAAMAFSTAACGDSGGAGGGGDTSINGCTRETADDRTGEANVDLVWAFPHQECIVVDVGTTVTWTVSAPDTFADHPIQNGEPAIGSEPGPLTDFDGLADSVSVVFDEAGVFPYFCNIHLGEMQGVVFAE